MDYFFREWSIDGDCPRWMEFLRQPPSLCSGQITDIFLIRLLKRYAGWPMLDEMIYMLYAHPNLYVDTGALHFIPRKEYYYYLKRLVDAGFSNRIMFGSDGGLREGVKAIMEADFLSQQQKEDILHNNAVKFLRLELPK